MSVRGKQAGGQPGRRPGFTLEEQELRLRIVLELLAEGRADGEIKTLIATKFKMSTRSVEPYLRRARARLRVEIGKNMQDLRAESFAFYHSVLRNSKATVSEKIKARAQIDKLLGIAVAPRYQLELPPGGQAQDTDGKQDASQAVAQIRIVYGLRPVEGHPKSA